MTRAPDLLIDLTSAAHPSRTARKEIRRFLATRAVTLVEDAGVAVTEAVRMVAKGADGSIDLRAWFDASNAGLRVEVVARDADEVGDEFPIVAALSTSYGVGVAEGGAGVWFEMRPRSGHDRRGRAG